MSFTRAGITGRTRVFALLGDPVSHSLSPRLHNAAFAEYDVEAVYVALPCVAEHVECLMRALAASGGGGNVTTPHKRRAADVLDEASPAVTATGACNTFWSDGRGRLRGDNTDVVGFTRAAVALLGHPLDGRRVLVLGAGGAAAAAAYGALAASAAEVAIHNRTRERAAALAARLGSPAVEVATLPEDLSGFDLVVNATAVGMRPEDPLPMPTDLIPRATAALDLVYDGSHDATPWVRSLLAAGRRAADGRRMLVEQAAASAGRWSDVDAQPVMLEALRPGVAEG